MPNRRSITALLSSVFLTLLVIHPPAPITAQSEPAENLTSQPETAESGSLAGTIVPAHDHAFTLATARIPDLGVRVEVDADGNFHFGELRPGSYMLEVNVPTLGSSLKRIEIVAGQQTTVEVEIRAGSHFEEELFVSAPGSNRNSLDLANASTSLSGDELQLRLESSLGETLANEPGVSSSFFGAGASRPIIRGLSGDRVRVMEGGLATGDLSDVSADHAVTSDPLQAVRIEVLRGPAALLYGSSAIGGAVNVIDERIPTLRASDKLAGTVDLRASSVADERTGAVNLNGGAGRWAWHGSLLTRDTDAYEVPRSSSDEGVVPNSDLETQSGRFGISHFFGDQGFLGISLSGLDTDYGIPRAASDDESVRIDIEQRRFDLHGEVRRSFGIFQALKIRAGSTDYEHTELEDEEIGTRFFNDYFETRVELIQREGRNSRGSVGIQASTRDTEAVGEEAYIPPTVTDRWAVFSFQEIESGNLSWQFGARIEGQEVDARDLESKSSDGVSASMGVVYKPGESWSLAGSLARSVKLPAPEELYSDGVHVASRAYEVGDPELDEEVGVGLDLSLRRSEGRLTGELTLFRQDFDDFIYQAFTGQEREGFTELRYRQSDAVLSGAELEARLELFERNGHHLHLQFVGDLVEAELDSGGKLPRIPPLRLGVGLHYHSERWSAMTELRYVDEQSHVASNELPTDSYTMVNASLSHRFIFGEQLLDLLLRGRNLTDEEARSHTSLLKGIAPQPGRDISFALRLWF